MPKRFAHWGNIYRYMKMGAKISFNFEWLSNISISSEIHDYSIFPYLSILFIFNSCHWIYLFLWILYFSLSFHKTNFNTISLSFLKSITIISGTANHLQNHKKSYFWDEKVTGRGYAPISAYDNSAIPFPFFRFSHIFPFFSLYFSLCYFNSNLW